MCVLRPVSEDKMFSFKYSLGRGKNISGFSDNYSMRAGSIYY